MRVVEIQTFGAADVLAVIERPEPAPAEGRVRVRVLAAAVNPVDVGVRAGAFTAAFPQVQPPLVLGWDFTGTVLDNGGGFETGQRVAGLIPWFDELNGTNAEVVLVEPGWLSPLPDGVDPIAAATLPLNGLTAQHALELTQARAGQTLLVTGASGGVGGFAVQLAATAGVHVVAVASSGDESFVSSLGAKDVVTRAGNLVDTVHALFPDGVDAVLDAGVAGPDLIGVVRDGGTFVAVIDPARPESERDITVDKVSVTPDPSGLAQLLDAFARGRLTTRVDSEFPLADAAQAHRRLETEKVLGKVVLTV